MRHQRVRLLVSRVRTARRFPITRERVIFFTIVATGIWMAWSLAQEIALTRQLSHDAAQLQQQNAWLRSSNTDYRRDIASVSSGASSEQDARQGGYARPGEKVYLVTTPPPSTQQAPAAAPSTPANPLAALWSWLTGH
jgi:cell division protein FtsB